MADETVAAEVSAAEEAELRVYEAGYLILPTVKEEEIEQVVSGIRSVIEKANGQFIAEGAPVSQKLAYTMYTAENGKRTAFERAWFGWLKFEVSGAAAQELRATLGAEKNILRSIVFRTTREDTRAIARSGVLREVKRTDTIKSKPQAGAEASAGVVSEEQLDKSIDELIKE